MSTILSALLLAATATATVTTTLRMPRQLMGSIDGTDYDFQASVVGVGGGKTTLAFDLPQYEDDAHYTETYTFQGNTVWEGLSTTSDVDEYYSGGMTASVRCDMPVKGAGACTFSYNGQYLVNMYCDGVKSATEPQTEVETVLFTYTDDKSGFEKVQTVVRTDDYSDYYSIPDGLAEFCKTGGSVLPEELALTTSTMSNGSFRNYKIAITAGEEKLTATAGAVPTNSGAQPTGTAAQATVAAATGSGGAGAAVETGAAAPMVVPALAGLGAAVAAFLL